MLRIGNRIKFDSMYKWNWRQLRNPRSRIPVRRTFLSKGVFQTAASACRKALGGCLDHYKWQPHETWNKMK